MAYTAGAVPTEIPAPDRECIHTYIYIYIYIYTHIDLVCMLQAHNASYIVNNSNINGKSYNRIKLRHM